ncbi:MAG TPA: hypothetical protein PKO06_24180 [Candidatus Ozemobacteraceae bacterium]|nr:hypothetical protein [Candidatus Ozemobacteraceae bacterium]
MNTQARHAAPPRRAEFRIIDHAPPSLEEAEAFVGGKVELLALKDDDEDIQILMNAQWMEKNLPINHPATDVSGTMVFGNAILLVEDALWKNWQGYS